MLPRPAAWGFSCSQNETPYRNEAVPQHFASEVPAHGDVCLQAM